jgi:hypothetical protein
VIPMKVEMGGQLAELNVARVCPAAKSDVIMSVNKPRPVFMSFVAETARER